MMRGSRAPIDISEATYIVVVSIRIIELRMVEKVEGFGAELKLHISLDVGIFQQRHIPVIDSGADKGATHDIADLAKIFRSKIIRIEVRQSFSRIAIDVERAAIIGIVWHIEAGIGSDQRIVVILT